jgi:diadenosine tetraphosphatase ApaH/serine/threonine PP2A family protein phosphatase
MSAGPMQSLCCSEGSRARPTLDDVNEVRVNGAPAAVLYDIHGNLAALEAVLVEAEAAGVTNFVLGGDYAAMGPWPRETAELLDALPATVRIRGNVERWLLEKPEAPPAAQRFLATAMTAARNSLGPALVDRLYGLPHQAEFEGIVVCHGSPISDIESFAPRMQAGEEQMLNGDVGRTILFGHSHVQFARQGPGGTMLINPGSVGAPLDGDVRAAWALFHEGGIQFRRTEYDNERAAAQMRSLGEWADPVVYRIEHASDRPEERDG